MKTMTSTHESPSLVVPVLLLGLVLSYAGMITASASEVPGDENAAVLAAYPLTDLEGHAIKVEDLRGEIVVVNFWATWCKPCKKEMPLLDRLHRRMGENRGRVLAVSIDVDPRRAVEFVDENELSLPVFVDGPDGLARMLDLEFLPYTIVIDAEGRTVYSGAGGPGENWERVAGLVDHLLAQSPPREEGAVTSQ